MTFVRRTDVVRIGELVTCQLPDERSSRLACVAGEAPEAKLIAMAGYRVIAALGSTLRWRTEGLEHLDDIARSGRQPVMAFWHGRILPATYFFRRRGIVVITSENFDGEWIAGIIERFGYGTARGSTSRGARKALLQLTREMAEGGPPASPSTARAVRRESRSRARSGWRRRRETRCCRSTSRPTATGRFEAGIGRRSPSRSPRWRWPSASRSTCRPTPDEGAIEEARRSWKSG